MKFAQIDADIALIQAYDAGCIRIAGREHTRGLLLAPGRVDADFAPAGLDQLTAEHMTLLIDLAPQVVVLGTGQRQRFPDPAIYAALMAHGIGIEIMDTGAACRTYNILASEGRRVVALLLLDD